MPRSSTSNKPTRFLSFAAAVAASADALGLYHAEAHRAGRHYFVAYKPTTDAPYVQHTEALTCPAAALDFFIRSATARQSHQPVAAAAPEPYTDTTNYLRPLCPSVHDVLPLTAAERQTCRVFALDANRRDEDDQVSAPRFAVCQPCPREQWGQLNPGDLLVYTELYQFTEQDGPFAPGTADAGPPRSLVTHVGPLQVHDARRGLFYACSWNGNNSDLDLAADDVQEVYLVRRFIDPCA